MKFTLVQNMTTSPTKHHDDENLQILNNDNKKVDEMKEKGDYWNKSLCEIKKGVEKERRR
jgi:hypothetical protein